MAKDLFTEQEQQQIVAAVKEAELNTSGEIKVHIERKCKEDVLDHAAFMFDELDMQKTELRNGVLIYLAVEDRKLAILVCSPIVGTKKSILLTAEKFIYICVPPCDNEKTLCLNFSKFNKCQRNKGKIKLPQIILSLL